MKNLIFASLSLIAITTTFINGYPAEISIMSDNMLDENISEEKIVPELETFYMCLLKRGPNWTADESPENINLQNMHQQHLFELMDSGQLLLASIRAGVYAYLI